MPEEHQDVQEPEVTQEQEVDVSEDMTGQLNAKDEVIAELRAELKAKEADEKTVAELQAESAQHQARIAELMAAQDKAEVREFCQGLTTTTLTNEAGQKFLPSPAFMALVEPHIAHSPSTGVIEFAEGTKTPRQAM